jgi:hypothetical protein
MIHNLEGNIRDLRDVELPVSLIVRRSCGSTSVVGVTLESWER